MFGSHLSIAGGLHNALLKAEEYGCQTVQIFTKNQQQWRCSPLTTLSIQLWKQHAGRLKFRKTVSHDSYLINLAATNEVFRRQSIDLFAEELRRCAALGIPYLVTHPGAHMGAGEEAGLAKVVAALDEVHGMVPDTGVLTCLEITAGQGSGLGYRLEHLAEIMECVRAPERVSVCLDTAHLFAAGYDFRGRKYPAFRREISRTIGLRSIKVLHVNDSKKDLGSRVDRHDHIGRGKIGRDGFKAILSDEAFRNVPKILETPKEKDEQGRDWDQVNLEVLRALVE
jgi:deoxyribonuclease-4